MMEAPLPNNEAIRLETLCQLQILDTAPEAAFDDLSRLAAQICGTPIALVSLIDVNRQWFKSKVGVEASETPRDVAFCAHAILQSDLFIIPDALADERFATNPLVTGPPFVRFYAGFPLITAEGHALGTLCVIDHVPRELEPQQQEALRALGRQVVAQLELRRSLADLSRTITKRQRKEKRSKQFFNAIGTGFGVAAAILVSIGAISYQSTTQLVETIGSVVKSRQIISKLEELSFKLIEAETGERGYLLTGDETYLEPYQTAIKDINYNLEDLRKLAKNNPQQQQEVDVLEPLIARRLAKLKQIIDLRKRQKLEAALQLVQRGEGKLLMREIRVRLTQMKNEQESLIRQQSGRSSFQTNTFAFLVGIFLVLVVLAMVYYFINQEITERKQAEEDLSEERDFVSAVLDTAGALIVVLDQQGRIIRFNRACEKITGYSFPEARGKHLWDLFLIPEEVEPVKAVFKQLKKGQLSSKSENYWVTKDGSLRLISWTRHALLNADDSVKYFIAAGIDITERQQAEVALRKSEAKTRAFLRLIPDLIMQLSGDGIYLDVITAEEFDTLIPSSNIIGKNLYDLLPTEVAQQCLHYVKQALQTKETQIFEYQLFLNNIRQDYEARVIVSGENEVLAIVRDITERKRAEAALQAEQEKSEQLLLNILPEPIANRLKQKESNIADSFAEVTVMFADIVDFTLLSTHISPTELVNLLNRIFSMFDQLAEQHGLEKIKTIGDAYMVVGGLPLPRPDHAQAIAEMALDMQKAIEQFNTENNEIFRMRIGINTGPVVAGVIGIKKFSYDLWGDTVNTASRMESHGLPGYIQLTEQTYELLREKYILKERGVIQVKGKGEMRTYLLASRKENT